MVQNLRPTPGFIPDGPAPTPGFIPDTPERGQFSPTPGFVPDESQKENMFLDTAGEFLKGIPRGFMAVGRGLVGTVDFLTGDKIESLDRFQENIESAQTRKGIRADATTLAGKGGALVGEAVPYLASSLFGAGIAGGVAKGVGLASKARAAQMAGGAAVTFATEGQRAYDEAIRKPGVTEAQANTERVLVGSISAVLESFMVDKFIGFKNVGRHSFRDLSDRIRDKAWKKAGKELSNVSAQTLKIATNEAMEEFLQEGASIAVPATLRGDVPKTKDGSVDWWEISTRMGTSGLAGGVAGGILGTGLRTLQVGSNLAAPTKESLTELHSRINQSDATPYEKYLQTEVLNDIAVKEGIQWQGALHRETGETIATARSVARRMRQFELKRPESSSEAKQTQGEKFADMRETWNDPSLDGESRAKLAAAKAIGYNRAELPGMVETFTTEEFNALRDSYHREPSLKDGERLDLDSFFRTVADGRLPSPGEIKTFDRIFGTKLADAKKAHQSYKLVQARTNRDNIKRRLKVVSQNLKNLPSGTSAKIRGKLEARRSMLKKRLATNKRQLKDLATKRTPGEIILDTLNLPKSVMSSFDNSFAGRQGWMWTFSHPIQSSRHIASGWRSMLNPVYSKVQEMDIKTDPNFKMFEELGLEFTEGSRGAKAEEEFRSTLAENLPSGVGDWITRSNVGFSNVGNAMRWRRAYRIAKEWEGTGKSPEDYQALVRLLNASTGRGSIPNWVKERGLEPAFNFAFWAPRLVIGKAQTLGMLVSPKTGTAVRKVVAYELARSFGAVATGLAVLASLPGVNIELDPRSSDWGKVRVGNTRYDFWGGYQQLFRLVAQLALGERKATSTGKVSDVEGHQIIGRFLRSKLSPTMGMGADYVAGETFLGEEMSLDPEFLEKYLREKVTPLFLQDLTDSLVYEGVGPSLFTAPLGVHGIGSGTYEPTARSEAARLKNQLAQQIFGTDWEDVGPTGQQMVREMRPSIINAEKAAKEESTSYNFVGKIMDEARRKGEQTHKRLIPPVKEELSRLGVSLGPLKRQIGRDWYLNKDRYDLLSQRTSEALNTVLGKLVKNQGYQNLPPEAQVQLVEAMIDDLKSKVRKQIVNEATFKDIENLKRKRQSN